MNPLRRRLLLATAALAAAPRLSAQSPGRSYTVGAIFPMGAASMKPYRDALAKRLARHGFTEGGNLTLEARSATGIFHEDREVARELVAKKVDALFTCGTRVTQAAKGATQSVPIVFAWVEDPVASGIVSNLAQPGLNVTGASNRRSELTPKLLELTRELLPRARRVAVLDATVQGFLYQDAVAERARKAAKALDLTLINTRTFCCSWEAATDGALGEGADALVTMLSYNESPVSGALIIEKARAKQVPMISADLAFASNGGLLAFGTDVDDELERGADLLARVLKGDEPRSLPVDQASQFKLVVNRKTGRAIGIDVPHSILLRADRVIE